MSVRLPWILSRRRLLVAVLLDSFLSVTLSNYLYHSSSLLLPRPQHFFVFFVLLADNQLRGEIPRIEFYGPYGVSVLQGLFQTIFVLD